VIAPDVSTLPSPADAAPLLEPLKRLHEMISRRVVDACERATMETLAAVDREAESDTIYAIDTISEAALVAFFARDIAPWASLVLIAEGLDEDGITLPRGTSPDRAAWRIIVDPIDGTRGLMYQKRSAWVLTGVAPNRGPETTLADIVLAVQTEVPVVKQHLFDVLWATRGGGAQAERVNRLTGSRARLPLRPSQVPTIAHGYAGISRFFPGGRADLAEIDDEIVLGALGPVQPGRAQCFEDQYVASGGQLYELLSGHDRFVADLRPLLAHAPVTRGSTPGICAHPYDLCTSLIATEAGAIVTDVAGGPLRARLALTPDVAWAGYANGAIRAQIEPLLHAALMKRNLWPTTAS
jgi:fructose-1,6-bisphosphatase/inositol monophosphatase family enzyme